MVRHQLLIVLIGLVIFATNLGSAALFDMDEALYADCACEMSARGDWVVPWFNGEMFPDKPPLMFWFMMFGQSLFGETELAVRLHSVLCAIGTALITYHIGRLLFRAEVGFWAGIITSTTIIYTISARAATVDAALTLATTGAMFLIVVGGVSRLVKKARAKEELAEKPTGPGRWHNPMTDYLPKSWWSFVLLYSAVAIAVLAKGPVGILMTIGGMGLFLLLMHGLTGEQATSTPRRVNRTMWSLGLFVRHLIPWFILKRIISWAGPLMRLVRCFHPKRLVQAAWALRPITGMTIVALIAGPWYYLVWQRTDGVWIYEFLAKYNIGPAKQAILGHTGPFYYHVLVIFIGFFPWSVFLGPMVAEMFRNFRIKSAWRVGYLFAAGWAIAIIGLWSAVAMKLPHHILPAYPAIALLMAPFIYHWITDYSRMSQWWMRNAALTFVLVGLGIIIAMPIVCYFIMPGEWLIGLVGLPLVIGGILCWRFSEARMPRKTMACFVISSTVFLVAMFGFAVLRVDQHQNGPALAEMLKRSVLQQEECDGKSFELGAFGHFRESFVYYTKTPVRRLHEPEDVAQFIAESDCPFVITTDVEKFEKDGTPAKTDLEKIREASPVPLREIFRRRRFLKKGDIVVLIRESDIERQRVAAQPDMSMVR
ncbi:MAG: glycosyltransferase family 39 protein [Planctomycetia bacterium]|jgi:4-amino-4-deoxy-L-arabinose transferase-like glycosyltransferase